MPSEKMPRPRSFSSLNGAMHKLIRRTGTGGATTTANSLSASELDALNRSQSVESPRSIPELGSAPGSPQPSPTWTRNLRPPTPTTRNDSDSMNASRSSDQSVARRLADERGPRSRHEAQETDARRDDPDLLCYGDHLRLWACSEYALLAHNGGGNSMHGGQSIDSTGGYVGVYFKGRRRKARTRQQPLCAVPPLGSNFEGEFVESLFRVTDPTGKNLDGEPVHLGAELCLVDADSHVWNSSTNGAVGYLAPRLRGEVGETRVRFVRDLQHSASFAKQHRQSKLQPCVRFGDALWIVTCAVSRDDASHPGVNRSQLRREQVLTNYKKETSSLLGGYMTIDARGYPLLFTVCRPPPALETVQIGQTWHYRVPWGGSIRLTTALTAEDPVAFQLSEKIHGELSCRDLVERRDDDGCVWLRLVGGAVSRKSEVVALASTARDHRGVVGGTLSSNTIYSSKRGDYPPGSPMHRYTRRATTFSGPSTCGSVLLDCSKLLVSTPDQIRRASFASSLRSSTRSLVGQGGADDDKDNDDDDDDADSDDIVKPPPILPLKRTMTSREIAALAPLMVASVAVVLGLGDRHRRFPPLTEMMMMLSASWRTGKVDEDAANNHHHHHVSPFPALAERQAAMVVGAAFAGAAVAAHVPNSAATAVAVAALVAAALVALLCDFVSDRAALAAACASAALFMLSQSAALIHLLTAAVFARKSARRVQFDSGVSSTQPEDGSSSLGALLMTRSSSVAAAASLAAEDDDFGPPPPSSPKPLIRRISKRLSLRVSTSFRDGTPEVLFPPGSYLTGSIKVVEWSPEGAGDVFLDDLASVPPAAAASSSRKSASSNNNNNNNNNNNTAVSSSPMARKRGTQQQLRGSAMMTPRDNEPTAEEMEAVADLRVLAAPEAFSPRWLEDGELLRFVRARKTPAQRIELFREAMDWRQQSCEASGGPTDHPTTAYVRDVELGSFGNLERQWCEGGLCPPAWWAFLAQVLPFELYGQDKHGLPVTYLGLGHMDLAGVSREVGIDRLEQKIVMQNDMFVDSAREMNLQSARKKEQPQQQQQQQALLAAQVVADADADDGAAPTTIIHGGVIIIDCDGMGRRHLAEVRIFRRVSAALKVLHPERQRKTFIVRAPRVFSLVWKLVKPMLDARIISKIQIFGYNDSLEPLEAELGKANIPTFLGGTCKLSSAHISCDVIQTGAYDDFVKKYDK